MPDYTPPVNSNNGYLNSNRNTWGTANQTRQDARDIQHVTERNKFAIEMIEASVDSFDSIEKMLMELAAAPVAPTQAQISSIAHQIDAIQKQTKTGILKLKEFQNEIISASQQIQTNRNGW